MPENPQTWMEVVNDPLWKELKTPTERNKVRMNWVDQVLVPRAESMNVDAEDLTEWFIGESQRHIDADAVSVSISGFRTAFEEGGKISDKDVKAALRKTLFDPGKELLDMGRDLQRMFEIDPREALWVKHVKDISGIAASVATFIPELADEIGTVFGKIKNNEVPDWDDAPAVKGMLTAPLEGASTLYAAFSPIRRRLGIPDMLEMNIINGKIQGEQLTDEEIEQAQIRLIERPFSTVFSVAFPFIVAGRAMRGVRAGREFTRAAIESLKEPEPVTGFRPARIAETQRKADVERVNRLYDEQRIAEDKLHKTSVKNVIGDFSRRAYDVSANVKRNLTKAGDAGRKAVVMHDLMMGANSRSTLLLAEADRMIFDGLNKAEIQALGDMRQSLRTAELIEKRPAQIQHPGGVTSEHTAWLRNLKNQVGEESYNKISRANDLYKATVTDNLKLLLDEGLIDEGLFNELSRFVDYNPRRFLEHEMFDPEFSGSFGTGKKITVTDSGIPKIKEGSMGMVTNNPKLLLQQIITRTQGRLAHNRANKALLDFAETAPDNGFVKVEKPIDVTKAGVPKYGDIPTGFTRISAMVGGKRQNMLMKNEWAKEWVQYDPEIAHNFAQALRIGGGGFILRPMATGINPEFAATNIFRDIKHIYLTALDPYGKTTYNPALPIAAGQMLRDIITVAPDVFARKGRYRDYILEGGGMEFMTMQGRPFKLRKGSEAIGTAHKVLEYTGMTSELLTRVAVRERMLRRGLSPEDATWTARNYLDFSQGGSFVKGLDSFFPYLNASVQGTRGIIRAAKTNPVDFSFRVAQMQTIEAGLYFANRETNPKAWAAISDRQKEANFIITTGLFDLDVDGQKVHYYVTIPKDQGQRIFTTMMRAGLERTYEGKMPYKEMFMSVQDFLPLIPLENLPPSLSAYWGYQLNKDIYFKNELWKGREVSPEMEAYRNTHPAYKKFGEVTGLSPVRSQYFVDQFLTKRSVYKDAVALGYNLMLGDMPESEAASISAQIAKIPVARKYFKKTYPGQVERETIERLRVDENDRRMKLEIQLDESVRAEDKDAVRQLMRDNPTDIKWMTNWQKRRLKNKDVRFLWIKLMNETPIVRARYFFDEWVKLPENEQNELFREVGKIGFVTKDFAVHFGNLKKAHKEQIKGETQ